MTGAPVRAPGDGSSPDSAGWPTAPQELLLTAAVADAREAIPAWEEWNRCTDLVRDSLDQGSLRLLPMVYRNLARHGHADPLMPRLKGVYRYWWLRNQGTFRRAAGVIGRLADRGIDTLALKGVALSVLFYRDLGARPMSDFDLLVPTARAAEAAAILAAAGWTGVGTRHPGRFRFRHGIELVDDLGSQCDLHWHVLRESLRASRDESAWRHAVHLEVGGTPTRALDATDTLLHVIVHGLRWNAMPPLRWVADALTVLGTATVIEWDRLCRAAIEERFALRLRRGLGYLRSRFGAPIPDAAMAALAAAPVSVIERLEARYLMVDERDRARLLLSRMPYVLIAYLRVAAALGPTRGLAALPDFLAFRLDVAKRRRLPGALLRSTLRSFRRAPATGLVHPGP